jgi:glycine cleavage system H protein
MPVPTDRRYSESHEWFLVEDKTVTIGITQHAADELTDITYVEMQPTGSPVDQGSPIGEVESVKTTSEVFSVIAGKVLEVNQAVADDPSIVNSDPYGNGWLIKLHSENIGPLEDLMDGATYESKHA